MFRRPPGSYIRKIKEPKRCRKAFEKVLTATMREQPAEEDDLQLLIDYASKVECKITREGSANTYFPLYEVVTAILPEAMRLHRWVHEDEPRLAAAGAFQYMTQERGGTTR